MSATRDGGIDRRAFVRGVARAAAAVAAGGVGIGRVSELLAATPRGSLPLGSETRIDRPFNMICLGDSVMWGQGLANASKFTTQVQNWLQGQLGREVTNLVLARSGATISPDGTVPAPWMTDRKLNEVPCSIPYVQDQVKMAHDEFTKDGMPASDVDLVLVDGGANDVNIKTILNPVTTTEAKLRASITNKLRGPMQSLIGKIHYMFPKAKVVVTGYYPPVGPDTDLLALAAFLEVLFPAGSLLTPFIKAQLKDQSNVWFEASNTELAAAVRATQGSPDFYYGTTPIQFAKLDSWGASNCYASGDPTSTSRAARSWMYLVAFPDEVFVPRQRACVRAGLGEDPLCRDASMGHPNPDGAIEYANAILPLLRPYLPEWKGLKLMQACLEMDPMPVPGKTSIVTVNAVERHTSTPVPNATVRIGTQTIPANTAVQIALCKTTKVSRVTVASDAPKSKQTEMVDACAPIVISAPGFVDAVIDDYPFTASGQ
jgi:lysophospholipase L1-like esterase